MQVRLSLFGVYQNFATDGSLHGVSNHLLRQTLFRKSGWLCLFIISMFTLFYQEIELFYEALVVRPTFTSLEIEKLTSFEFPDLILCDGNPEDDQMRNFAKLVSRRDHVGQENINRFIELIAAIPRNPTMRGIHEEIQMNISRAIEKYPNLEVAYGRIMQGPVDPGLVHFYGLKDTFEETLWANYMKLNESSDFSAEGMDLIDVPTVSLLRLEEQVIFCRWKDSDCLDGSNWSLVDTMFGICHKLTIPDRSIHHSREKLHLILNARVAHSTWSVNPAILTNILFSDPVRPSRVSLMEFGFVAASGKSYSLGVSHTKYSDVSGKTDCRTDLEYFQSECIEMCVANTEHRLCDCTSFQWNRNESRRNCGLFDNLFCRFRFTDTLVACFGECRSQCSFSTFSVKSSSADIAPSDSHLTRHAMTDGGGIAVRYMRDNLIEITVSITGLEVRKVTVDLKYRVKELFSAVGDLFGLFVGASMVTIVELVELVLSLGDSFVHSVLCGRRDSVGPFK